MKVIYNRYLSISDGTNSVALDPLRKTKKTEVSLTTHSHTDHYVKSNNMLSSPETKKLIETNFNQDLNFESFTKTKEVLDNVFVTPLNAGHILGSNMFYFENKNTSLLYTGDFKTTNSLLFKGAKPVHADTLIIESTFGNPRYIFPNKDQTYMDFATKLEKDIKDNKLILIGAYALGKTQELIKFLNVYLKETPLVMQKAFDFSKVYNDFGLSLGNYELANSTYERNILILPINLIKKDFIYTLEKESKREVKAYIASGWNHYRIAESVPISDHCDFVDLIDFVANVAPKRVFTTYGFCKDLSKAINKELGIYSTPVDCIKKSVFDY